MVPKGISRWRFIPPVFFMGDYQRADFGANIGSGTFIIKSKKIPLLKPVFASKTLTLQKIINILSALILRML
jgi:hypothetical protein